MSANQVLITLEDGSQVAIQGVPADLPIRVMTRPSPGAMWSPPLAENAGKDPHHSGENVHRGEW